MARLNRELCMLANVFDATKDRIAGMYMSEKLDGMRCLWLPNTKGLPVAEIPFANRRKDKREHVATGLWSRYGKIIHCPSFFTKGFPDYPLDGELFMGRGNFQTLMSTVKEIVPYETDWKKVQYLVFDAPQYETIFQSGRINNPQYQHTMKFEEIAAALKIPESPKRLSGFDFAYRVLQKNLYHTDYLSLLPQRLLPFKTEDARRILDEKIKEVADAGGEGLILRHPASEWEPIRSKFLLKVVPFLDAEATVIGYRAGQGKYLGMLGSLTVRFGDTTFELSGFTDEERRFCPLWNDWSSQHPGSVLPSDSDLLYTASNVFPLGSTLTFRYRELSDDGIPKQARYLRKRDE